MFQCALPGARHEVDRRPEDAAFHEASQRCPNRRKQNRHTNLSFLKLPPVHGQ